MARNETSRLKITIDIDKATGKILQFNQTLGNTEKKVQQTGQAMGRLSTATNQAGQSATASAVNFQTFSMGLLNLSTSAVQTWTSISNLDRAVNRHKMSVIAVARAQDLLANKEERLRTLQEAGHGATQKAINLKKELATASADLTVKMEKEKIEAGAVNDVYMLFGANIANVVISSMQTIAVMDKNQVVLNTAKTATQKLYNLSIFNASKASLAHTAVMYKSATANLVVTTTTVKLTLAVKRLTLATKAFITSNPVLIAAMAVAGGALLAYETNFLGLKDAIHGTTEETKTFKEEVEGTRNSIEGLDGAMNDLSSTSSFKLPTSIGEAKAALIRYRAELDEASAAALNLAGSNQLAAKSMDEVQKKTTNNKALNFILGLGIIQTAEGMEMPVSSLGYVPPIQSTPSVRFKYGLNDFGHTIKVPMTTAEVETEYIATQKAAYLASLTEMPFFTMNNEKSKWLRMKYHDDTKHNLNDMWTTNAARLADKPQFIRDEEFAAYSVELTLKEYLDKQADGTLEKYIEAYSKDKHAEYSQSYAYDPAFRQSVLDQKTLEQSLNVYKTPLDYTIEQAKLAGDREQAEIDKKKRAAPAERLLLSSLANKIYQEQNSSIPRYDNSGNYLGGGFNPKQYTNLVRQQAAKQGIDMSKFENVIMNGINLSTGEEVKTMREKAGYKMPDKPKGSDFRKRLIGKASGIYKKDEPYKHLSLGMQLLLDKDYDEGNLLGEYLNPMEERLRIMAKYDMDVGMGGQESEAIMALHYQSLGDSRKDLISEYLVGGTSVLEGGYIDEYGNRVSGISDRNISGTTPFQQKRKSLATGMSMEQFEQINEMTSILTNNARAAATRYYDQVVYGEATGSMARSHAAAQALGRATWGREQAKQQTMHTGGSGMAIVNHYVRNSKTAEDGEAINSLGRSHDEQLKEAAQQAFDSGKKKDMLWLRIQTENQAKALNASISARIAAERATALQFGNQLGISQNEALQILRDKSQGEQTLNDMLAFQQRLDAMSSGVV